MTITPLETRVSTLLEILVYADYVIRKNRMKHVSTLLEILGYALWV